MSRWAEQCARPPARERQMQFALLKTGCSSQNRLCIFRHAPRAANPEPSSSKIEGSGTSAPLTTPVTFTPDSVPNEKTAPVIVVSLVTPAIVKFRVMGPARNGLCAGLPAIDPLAVVY